MLNIVIPMAGAGSRFSNAGYKDPKPLIDVHGKHMIEVVVNNLKPKCDHRFIFIVQKKHRKEYNLDKIFATYINNYKIIEIDGITEGAAVTVLKAYDLINTDTPLMIANSDQWIDIDVNKYLKYIEAKNLDGCMLTMKSSDPKWSYAKINSDNLVTEVVEKVVISDEATVGIYNFSKGSDFCKYATEMINKNIRSNGEFYVAPVYTFMSIDSKSIGVYNIGAENDGMYGLGTPKDLEYFLTLPISKNAILFS